MGNGEKNHKKEQSKSTPIEEYSLEELNEVAEELRSRNDANGRFDTAHSDGSTSDPHLAEEQGLVYDPPSDPPVLPSDDFEGVEIATGFASSMEEANPDVRRLPDRVDNQDLDLEEDIAIEIRNNSETGNLHDIDISVENGVVWLRGTVPSQQDIAIVDYMVRDLEGVKSVRNDLQIADSE